MTIQFTIDRAKNLTVFNLSGEVTISEFFGTLRYYGEKKPTRFELYDARNLSGERFATTDIQGLAHYLNKHADKRPPDSKTAVIVNKTIDYGISRMISMLTEGDVPYKIEVFRSIDDAYQWLDEP